MEAEPLDKTIFEKALKMGITKIALNFQGGNDEGNLYVGLEPYSDNEFEQEIEDWAWGVYDYSGAGEDIDFGDNILYDLKEGKVYTDEWSMQRVESESEEVALVLSEPEPE